MTSSAKPTSWLPDILASLTVASGIGYLITVYGVSRWLTRSARAKPRAAYWNPDCTLQELSCRTSDGLRLEGWAISPAHPHATLAIFHGMRGNREDMLDRIGFLTDAGYRCVAFDHRAHGQSDGKMTSFGFYEGRDVVAVREVIRQTWPNEPCAALGTSMGAAALCYAAPTSWATWENAATWDAVILEGLYHDLSTAFSTRIGSEYPRWFRFFSKGVVWITERRLRLRLQQLAPWRYMPNLAPTPVLLMTGEKDSHASPEDVARLYDCCSDPREFHVIADAGHEDVFEKGGSRYQELVLDFLGRHLRQRQRLAA